MSKRNPDLETLRNCGKHKSETTHDSYLRKFKEYCEIYGRGDPSEWDVRNSDVDFIGKYVSWLATCGSVKGEPIKSIRTCFSVVKTFF